jgi:hypothetical protein
MAESPAHFHWRNAPRSTFENFRDCSVDLLNMVNAVYREAAKLDGERTEVNPFIDAGNFWLDSIMRQRKVANEIWRETPIHRYLTRPAPVVFSLEGRRTRYDGCCYHEVAMNLAFGVWDSLVEKISCATYCSRLENSSGGVMVTDRLFSLMADVRSECAAGIDRFLAERAAEQTAPGQSDAMVTRQWIADQSGIPVSTLRGPKYSKLLGGPDECEKGLTAKWKKDRALDFITKHSRK